MLTEETRHCIKINYENGNKPTLQFHWLQIGKKISISRKKIQSIMMKTAENVCLVDEKAKAYCRKLQGKKRSSCESLWLKTRFVGDTNEWALLQSDDFRVSWHGVDPLYEVDGNTNAIR